MNVEGREKVRGEVKRTEISYTLKYTIIKLHTVKKLGIGVPAQIFEYFPRNTY
jgi:hypothetical protein